MQELLENEFKSWDLRSWSDTLYYTPEGCQAVGLTVPEKGSLTWYNEWTKPDLFEYWTINGPLSMTCKVNFTLRDDDGASSVVPARLKLLMDNSKNRHFDEFYSFLLDRFKLV